MLSKDDPGEVVATKQLWAVVYLWANHLLSDFWWGKRGQESVQWL